MRLSQAMMFATLKGAYTPASSIVPDIPLELETVLSMCLSVDKRRRIRDAVRLIELLRPIAGEVRTMRRWRCRHSCSGVVAYCRSFSGHARFGF
jgi:hypothetical protein